MNIYILALLVLFQFPFASDKSLEFPASSPATASQQKQKRDKTGAENMVFKSTDGGQTWQDISEGQPWQVHSLRRTGFFANDNGLYLCAGTWIYKNKPNSTALYWEKEISPYKQRSIAPGKAGIIAYNYEGQFLQKT
ncbi:MAG TPA: hypothetical protein VK625_00215, partial [Flavitalea sp.]|nr:hypothetical protein [Flavitalea sp.]